MTRSRVSRRTGWAALTAATLFAPLSARVLRDPGPLSADAALHRWSLEHRPPVAEAVARAVTATGTGIVPYALLVIAGLYVGRTGRERARTVALLVLCLGAGQALRYATMTALARPRPSVGDWATHASGWSFPSGHAATAAMTAGLVIAALLLRGGSRRVPRRTVVTLIGLWAAAVGLTRVLLGVHWFTDVVGGWLFATAWVCCLACVYARLAHAPRPQTFSQEAS
ncbi:phosphatase PAP2 family protein [Streptomyces sp. NPDC094032]|uniref:phosphatase PAP2 family protein n=1 Tax=Streptomyces sp. NPDC094032 TaxID=3155308 RepID=UPI00331BAFBE